MKHGDPTHRRARSHRTTTRITITMEVMSWRSASSKGSRPASLAWKNFWPATFRCLIRAGLTQLTVSRCRPARNQTASNRWVTKYRFHQYAKMSESANQSKSRRDEIFVEPRLSLNSKAPLEATSHFCRPSQNGLENALP